MINGVTAIEAELYKTLGDYINTNYRLTVPTLHLFTNGKRGAGSEKYNPNQIRGFVKRFQNNQLYTAFVDQVMYAQGVGNQAQLTQNILNVNAWVSTLTPISTSVEYDYFSQAITAKTKGAIMENTKLLIDHLTKGVTRTLNFQFWNTLANGAVSLTGAAGSATTSIPVTLDVDRPGTRYLTPGMFIQVAGATGGTSVPGNVAATQILPVNGINTNTQTLTVKDSLTFAAGALITVLSPDGSATTPITSIDSLVVDTGTVQGQNLDYLGNQKAHIYNTAGAFSAETFQSLYLAPETATIDSVFANMSVYNLAGSSLSGQERTPMGKQAYLDLGWRSFTANEGTTDVILDRDVPAGSMYGLWTEGWTWATLDDFMIMPMMGQMRVPRYLVYEIAGALFGQLTNANIEGNFKYQNITV